MSQLLFMADLLHICPILKNKYNPVVANPLTRSHVDPKVVLFNCTKLGGLTANLSQK